VSVFFVESIKHAKMLTISGETWSLFVGDISSWTEDRSEI